jgi:predicted nucleic acid-binding Zn ribbon protein
MATAVAELLQHRHCLQCGRAIPSGEDYCSDECKETRETLLQKKRRQLLYLYVGSVITMLLVIFFGLGGGG